MKDQHFYDLEQLDKLFKPSTVAIIGATDRKGSVGSTIIANLIKSHDDLPVEQPYEVFLVNPYRKECFGQICYQTVIDIPSRIDLGIIVTPSNTIKNIIQDCGVAEVPYVIIISAGFKEIGVSGTYLEKEIVESASKYKIRIIGPNCLGIMSLHWNMNASFAASTALKGNIAFMSQSGAICTAILDWALEHNVGFSSFVSLGSMADVDWAELVYYWGNDKHTTAILIYMETIGNATKFMEIARIVSKTKPIILLKAGKTTEAAEAAVSHTGSLVGSHYVFLKAMSQVGVLVVETIAELYNSALFLSKYKCPLNNEVVIITNAGGPGVITTDATVLSGARLQKLNNRTVNVLNGILPSSWSKSNPIDILGDASPNLFKNTLKAVIDHQPFGCILIILSPQSVTDSLLTAQYISELWSEVKSTINGSTSLICSWMGGLTVRNGFNLLNQRGIATYSYPDSAMKTFGTLYKYLQSIANNQNNQPLELKYELPLNNKALALSIITKAKNQSLPFLPESDSKTILKLYGIPVVETLSCKSEKDCIENAVTIGFPCVMKIDSHTITHKSDVGGVVLNINSLDSIKDNWAYFQNVFHREGTVQKVVLQKMHDINNGLEFILGSSFDFHFGHVLMFGKGGTLVEFNDHKGITLLPVTKNSIDDLFLSANLLSILKKKYSSSVASVFSNSIKGIVCQFSFMIEQLKEYVKECDVNPLLITNEELIALDARIILFN